MYFPDRVIHHIPFSGCGRGATSSGVAERMERRMAEIGAAPDARVTGAIAAVDITVIMIIGVIIVIIIVHIIMKLFIKIMIIII